VKIYSEQVISLKDKILSAKIKNFLPLILKEFPDPKRANYK